MNDHNYMATNARPSGTSAFFKGFASSTVNGAVMMGLVFAVGAAIAFAAPVIPVIGPALAAAAAPALHFTTFLASATLVTLATGLFGGVMAAKRALFDAPETAINNQPSYVAVPVQGMGAPTLAPVVALDRAEQPATQSWVSKTGRDGQATSNIQQILDNGTLSDKDRASAILAAREAAADTAQAR